MNQFAVEKIDFPSRHNAPETMCSKFPLQVVLLLLSARAFAAKQEGLHSTRWFLHVRITLWHGNFHLRPCTTYNTYSSSDWSLMMKMYPVPHCTLTLVERQGPI